MVACIGGQELHANRAQRAGELYTVADQLGYKVGSE